MDFKKWLEENKRKFDLCISKTECYKWVRYYYQREKPYPCVCPVREQDCIFLELYYELQKVLELSEKEHYFIRAIEEYQHIKSSHHLIWDWVKRHESVGSKLFFSSTITILCNSEKNEKLTMQLNPHEFRTVIQFQEIFNTVYYSEEFQTNFKP